MEKKEAIQRVILLDLLVLKSEPPVSSCVSPVTSGMGRFGSWWRAYCNPLFLSDGQITGRTQNL